MAHGLNPTLAKMINNVYYDKDKVLDYEQVAKIDSAQIYKRDKSKIWIYVVRGWYPHKEGELTDATALVKSSIASQPRYKKVKAFFQKHPAPKGYKVLAAGHSLGGAYVDQLIEDGIVKEGVSFNPAIQMKDLKNSGNQRYYNRHDFLYKLVGRYASNVHVFNSTAFDKIVYAANFLNLIKSYLDHNITQFEERKDYEEKKKKEEPESESEEEEEKPKPSSHRDERPTHQQEAKGDYIVQSIHLSKSKFEDADDARMWAAEHGYRHSKLDETPHEYRFRQVSPDLIKTGHYRPRSVQIGDKGYMIVLYK